jgi:hypothetical protein
MTARSVGGKLVLGLVWFWAAQGAAMAASTQPFTKASDCVVGQRVIDRDNQTSVVVEARGTTCVVQLDSTGKKDYNLLLDVEACRTSRYRETGKQGEHRPRPVPLLFAGRDST